METARVQVAQHCLFGRPVGRPHPALAHCPDLGQVCPCVRELLRHALGEVDAQTIDVVAFWQPLDPMGCYGDRDLLPKYREGRFT